MRTRSTITFEFRYRQLDVKVNLRSLKFAKCAVIKGKLYHFKKCEVVAGKETASIVSGDTSYVDLWHQRLDHLNWQQLNTLVNWGLASGITLSTTSKLSFWEGCVEGKMQCMQTVLTLSLWSIDQQLKKKLELIHSDVCGPLQVELISGSRY